MKGLTNQFNVKDHEFMVWSVIHTWLDSSFTIFVIGPKSTKIFSVDLNSENFFILFSHILLYFC